MRNESLRKKKSFKSIVFFPERELPKAILFYFFFSVEKVSHFFHEKKNATRGKKKKIIIWA